MTPRLKTAIYSEKRFVRQALGHIEGDLKVFDRAGAIVKHYRYNNRVLVSAKLKFRNSWIEYDLSGRSLKLPWKMRAEKICYLNQNDVLICKPLFEVWRDLVATMSPEEVANMMNRINGLYDELGLNEKDAVITSCAGTFVATSADAPAGRGRSPKPPLMSERETRAARNACSATVRGRLDAVLDKMFPALTGDQRIRDAVSHIDEVVANCQDDDNSMIAAGSIVDWFRGIFGANSAAPEPPPTARRIDEQTTEVTYKDKNNGEIIRVDIVDNDNNVVRSERRTDLGWMVIEYDSKGDAKVTFLDKDRKPIDNSEEEYDSEGRLVSRTGWYTAGPAMEIEIRSRNAIKRQKDGEPPRAQWGRIFGRPAEPDGMSKCAQLALWWDLKKQYCEASNWSTYDCQEILRQFNGCADPALVYPTPDGEGVVCPHEGDMTDADFRRLECERKSMIMIPSGFGTEICVDRGHVEAPRFTFERDICTDPVAQCDPNALVPSDYASQGYPPMASPRSMSASAGRPAETMNASASFRAYPHLQAVGDIEFDKMIGSHDRGLQFVAFVSKACGPCHKVLSVFQEESGNHSVASFHYVDVHQNPDLYKRFEIKFTPTILVFSNGSVIGQRRVGAASREVLAAYIKRSIDVNQEQVGRATSDRGAERPGLASS